MEKTDKTETVIAVLADHNAAEAAMAHLKIDG
jgi:hypothetical protein